MFSMEFIRFFLVAAVGLLIDTAVAWLLHSQFEVLLTLSSAIGFLIAAAINYVMHEIWTFRGGQRTLSTHRALSYIGVLGITLILRIAAVHLLQIILSSGAYALLILIIAAGTSFTVNFIASKILVFKSCPSTH